MIFEKNADFQVLIKLLLVNKVLKLDEEIGLFLLLSEGRTVVKCICECNQSGRRVIFYPEPFAMSTSFCAWCLSAA